MTPEELMTKMVAMIEEQGLRNATFELHVSPAQAELFRGACEAGKIKLVVWE